MSQWSNFNVWHTEAQWPYQGKAPRNYQSHILTLTVTRQTWVAKSNQNWYDMSEDGEPEGKTLQFNRFNQTLRFVKGRFHTEDSHWEGTTARSQVDHSCSSNLLAPLPSGTPPWCLA